MKSGDKISNLWSLNTDIQETIRFLDSKVAFITIVTGAMITSLVERLDIITEYFRMFSPLYYVTGLILLILLALSISLIVHIILPRQNPTMNIPKPYSEYSNLYLNKLSKKGKLMIPDNYEEIFQSEDKFADSLEAEYLKLSFIRTKKNDGISLLAKVLFASFIFFAIHICLEKYELKNIAKSSDIVCCSKGFC